MKIDFSKVVKGRQDKDCMMSDGKPLSLKEAVIQSLNHMDETTRFEGETKSLRGRLIRRLDKDECEFSVEEVSEMKRAVKQHPWLPIVHNSIENMLEEVK